MRLELPKDVLGSLPGPDAQGLVRVKAALKVSPDGKVEVVEINDQPLPMGDDENDDESPMPEEDLPDLSAAEDDIYQA